MSLQLLILFAFYSVAFALDPCDSQNHGELNEPHRSTGYVTGNEAPLCDNSLVPGWYRFTSQAGGQLPDFCPEKLHCGTVVPMWMNGTHPTVHDGIVRRKVCANFENIGSGSRDKCCDLSTDILVKNCGHFFVYFLIPPRGCPYAYCAGSRAPCPDGRYSINGDGFPPCSDAHPVMTVHPVLSDPIVSLQKDSFHFDCIIQNLTADPRQKFNVTLTFDGKKDVSIPPQTLADPWRVAHFDGYLLKNHINTNIGCYVESFYDQMEHLISPPLSSNTYYAGIEIFPTNGGMLTVDEKDFESNVTISSTLPIVCDHKRKCCLYFMLDIDSSNGQEYSVPNKCQWELCKEDWNNITNMASTQFPVVANKDMITDGDKKLQLAFQKLEPNGGGNYTDIFTGFAPTPLPVTVKDTPATVCSLISDPHIHGFDYETYHLFLVGDFTLCKVARSIWGVGPFEVTVRTWACGGTVTCACALVIREHNELIMIDQCDQMSGSNPTPLVKRHNTRNPRTVIQMSTDGKIITVYLASGSTFKVESSSRWLSIHMTVSPMYYGMCQGICGTNDGDKHNEFTHSDGSIDPICTRGTCKPNSFFESWRVPYNESMFHKVPATIADDINGDIVYCPCTDKHNGQPAVNCTIRGDLPVIPQANGMRTWSGLPTGIWTRKRRSTERFMESDSQDSDYIDIDPVDDQYEKMHFENNERSANVRSVISEEEAKDLCKRALQGGQLAKACQSMNSLFDSYLTDCMADLMGIGSTDFLVDVVNSFTSECQAHLAMLPSSYITSPSGENIMKPEISSDICLPGCTDHGVCGHGGVCQCNPGWEGDLCHLIEGQGPDLKRIRNGPLCDVRQTPCQTIYIDVTNIALSEDLACKIQSIDENGTNVGNSTIVEATMMSAGRLACHIPKTNVAIKKYAISATNDGILFGNTLELRVFDSMCMACQMDQCSHKQGTCYIDGLCYVDGKRNPENMTLFCDAANKNNNWTQEKMKNCPAGFSEHGGICYRFMKETETWSDAQDICKAMGSFLAEPRTRAEYNFIKVLVNRNWARDVWLGASLNTSNGQWQWSSSGDAVTGFTNWAPNSPNDHAFQHCLQMWYARGYLWDDFECSAPAQFVCQK